MSCVEGYEQITYTTISVVGFWNNFKEEKSTKTSSQVMA